MIKIIKFKFSSSQAKPPLETDLTPITVFIERLAKFFKVNKKELQVSFVSDQVAEQKITYFKKARNAAHV